MRINRNFIMRTVAGQAILVNVEAFSVDFNNMLSLSETAAWLWEKAAGCDGEFDEPTLVGWLTEEFDVDEETAARDVAEMVLQWREYGLVL